MYALILSTFISHKGHKKEVLLSLLFVKKIETQRDTFIPSTQQLTSVSTKSGLKDRENVREGIWKDLNTEVQARVRPG